MLSERPLNQRESGSRSPFGETINVVQAVFFHRAKCGDRFWYEFPKAGFTVSEYSDVTLTCASTFRHEYYYDLYSVFHSQRITNNII